MSQTSEKSQSGEQITPPPTISSLQQTNPHFIPTKIGKTFLRIKSLKPLHLIVIFLALLMLIAAFFYWRSRQNLQSFKENPEKALDKENQEIVKNIGKLIILPEGEEPTIATVTDPQKLQDQAFFRQAQQNDLVIIYQNAGKAILYRPSVGKIVDISPIDPSSIQQGETAGESTQKLRLVIRNGTDIAGLARNYQNEIKTKIRDVEVISVGDASTKDVVKTFIVALTNLDPTEIAATLGIETGSLPDGEPKPDADFLIILGSDKSSL